MKNFFEKLEDQVKIKNIEFDIKDPYAPDKIVRRAVDTFEKSIYNYVNEEFGRSTLSRPGWLMVRLQPSPKNHGFYSVYIDDGKMVELSLPINLLDDFLESIEDIGFSNPIFLWEIPNSSVKGFGYEWHIGAGA